MFLVDQVAQNRCLIFAVKDVNYLELSVDFNMINTSKLFVFCCFSITTISSGYGRINLTHDIVDWQWKSVQHFVSVFFQRSNIEVTAIFLKSFFLDLLKCVYCQITVSIYTILYCLPVRVLACSQVLFAIFFPILANFSCHGLLQSLCCLSLVS